MEFQITQLLRVLFESLFIGFAIIIPIVSLIKTSNLKTLLVKDLFVLQAVQAIRVAGIMNLLLALPDAYSVYIEQHSVGVTYPVSFQLFTFYPTLAYFILTQFFWFKKLYMKKSALITLCLFLLILPSDWILTILATLDAPQVEYLPASWRLHTATTLARIGLNIVIFFFTTFSLMVVSGKLKQFTEKK
ncbi:MAG: hypothetical protein V4581_18990 [Bacteroidota bacterium]